MGKQTYAYTSASKKDLLGVDISKTKVTGTQWATLAKGLNMRISELVASEHPDFIKKYGKETLDMSQHDWLKILEHSPQFLKYPIVIDGEDYIQIKSAAEFKKYIEPDSRGLEKSKS